MCSPNRTLPDLTEETPPPGMKRIAALGESFLQGAHDASAGVDERPCMPQRFTYNYWLDSTEVTQGQYACVMGGLPARTDTSQYGSGPRNPMFYVTWFDAVLFCNARSVGDHLDTVYSYDGPPRKNGENVYCLMNVVIHYDRGGYRLPTEAEWEYGAREGTSSIPFPHLSDSAEAAGYAWYAADASDKTHPVAGLRSNTFGLYDMAGNVYEWTGDWRGSYTSAAIVNSLGVPYSNSVGERVVKGGSFEHGFSDLRPSRRGTTYPSTPSSATEHIGFRCAWGVVRTANYIGSAPCTLATAAVRLVENDIRAVLGMRNARLVFVNVTRDFRTLCYVDFWSTYPGIYEFKDYTSVFKPAISPNGRHVAFSTGNDGQSGPATIFVRSLDSVTAQAVALPCSSAFGPRWWVDPSTRDTFIVYATSAEDNASGGWASAKTCTQRMRGRIAWGAPEQLIVDGGFHGGMTTDGRFVITGFTRLLTRDLTDNTTRVLFRSPANGKDAGSSSQACNVSVSPDTAGQERRCLFLDFGAPGGSTLIGRPYGIHEYLFMEDFTHGDSVVSWIRCPLADAAWNYPQWSNSSRFAVVCGENGAGQTHAVYVIDLINKAYRLAVEGTQLAHPAVWVSQEGLEAASEGFDIDSLGNYNDPPQYFSQQYFMLRMQGFWRKRQSMNTVFLGSSHTAQAINPRCFSKGTQTVNLAFGQGNFLAQRMIILNYLLKHCPKLRLIGMDVITGWMFKPDGNFQSAWNYISGTKGYLYDKNHGFWEGDLPPDFERLITAAHCPAVLPGWDTLGLDSTVCSNWGGSNPDIGAYGTDWTIDQSYYRANIDSLKSLIKTLSDRTIHLILYTTPESPYYKNTNAYGRWGPGRGSGEAMMAQLKALEDTFPEYYHFYDANRGGNHDYTDDEAWDFDHLCAKGAQKFSTRVSALVDSVLRR